MNLSADISGETRHRVLDGGNLAVDRCICHQVSFEELAQLAGEVGAKFDALRERTNCGSGCGMCIPYIRLMLATCKTDLPIMATEELERMLPDATESPPRGTDE